MSRGDVYLTPRKTYTIFLRETHKVRELRGIERKTFSKENVGIKLSFKIVKYRPLY